MVGIWVGGGAGRYVDVDRITVKSELVPQAVKYIYGPGTDNILLMQRPDGKRYFYHHDRLGSVSAISNEAGAIVETYTYDPYGRTKISDINGNLIHESAVSNPYAFTGRRLDKETGLYYYRARYYDPELGRFLQTDPIGYSDGMNMYAYAGNNPVNRLDPQGTAWRNVSNFFTSEKVTSGYYVGTGYGEDAVNYWAEKYTQTDNPLYLVPGSFSALWTPETYVQTAWTLLTAYQLNNAFVRPHYSQVQYYPSNNPSYPSKWSTRGTANNPPYSLGHDAKKALNLPKYNPGDAVRGQKINPFEPFLGPRPVEGGTGIEYYRGWRWPK